MKTKKYWILAVVVIVPMAGLVTRASGTKKPPIDKTRERRLAFLDGVFFAGQHRKAMLLKPSVGFNTKDTLTGIQGVQVVVDDLPPVVEKYGLRRQALQAAAELQLRQRGVEVVAERQTENISQENIGQAQEYEKALIQRVSEESDERFLQYVREYLQHGQQQSSATILAINVNAVVDEEMSYASYSIHIQLMQGVLLLGQSPRRSLATTWQIGRVGYISPGEFEEIREHVRDTIDEFINDYLAANPNRGSPVSFPKTRIPPRGLVTGIARSEDRSSAIIGTQIVREGQSIHGIKVVKIHKDKVEFEKNGKRWIQGLNEAPGPEWR